MRTRFSALPLLFLVAGCASATIGTKPYGEVLDRDCTIGGFAGMDGMRPYDGDVVTAGIFGSERPGEWLSFGVWPLFDLGLGPIGGRAQILPLEFGGGVGWYTPDNRSDAEAAARRSDDSRTGYTSSYAR